MSISFRPAKSFNERHGLFVAVSGGTNSGKTFSAMRLARGIAGNTGKIAVADTEGGRTLHLKSQFDFDVVMVDPPHRPERYADIAREAESADYAVLVIDSFSMEWAGLGGVLDWQASEFQRMGGQEKNKLASWIKPKMAHKAMVYSFLQRRMPIVFSMRAEEKVKKVGGDIETEWKPICNKTFPFEVTVSFMLMQNRQGVIDLRYPHKMEGSHRAFLLDGEQLSEDHGQKLAAWSVGASAVSDGKHVLQMPDGGSIPVERGAFSTWEKAWKEAMLTSNEKIDEFHVASEAARVIYRDNQQALKHLEALIAWIASKEEMEVRQ